MNNPSKIIEKINFCDINYNKKQLKTTLDKLYEISIKYKDC